MFIFGKGAITKVTKIKTEQIKLQDEDKASGASYKIYNQDLSKETSTLSYTYTSHLRLNSLTKQGIHDFKYPLLLRAGIAFCLPEL